MRTLHIGTDWFPDYPGGLARYFYELSRHLPAAGVEFRGLVLGSPVVDVASGGTVTAYSTRSAPLSARLRGVQRAATAALRADPDALVVSHFALHTVPLVAPGIGCLRKRPFVVHFHGPWALEAMTETGSSASSRLKTAARKVVERAVYARATVFVTLSRAFRGILFELYGVPGDRVQVVPGGADVARFSAVPSQHEARRAMGWPTDRPIVWTVRRLVRRMGLETLIDACAEIRRRIPDVLVLIAGRGPLQESLAQRIADTYLGDHVRLAGYISEEQLPLAYRAANLTVVPSVALEGFGLIAAESLAAGTPVMVTPVGGLPEVVADFAPHLVLAGTTAPDIADGVVAALRGDIALPSADACRRFAQERFAWPVVADRLREVYAMAV